VARPTIPHLDWPVRIASSGHLASNEQDSIDDIATCVAISLLTPLGYRDEEPEFGSRPDFPLLPIKLADLQTSIAHDEPRAELLLRAEGGATAQNLELRITARLTQARGAS
jgi:phage baseplate assembly protein W